MVTEYEAKMVAKYASAVHAAQRQQNQNPPVETECMLNVARAFMKIR